MSRVSVWSYELLDTTGARSQECCSSVTDILPVHRYAYPAEESRNWSAATDNCCHRNFLLHSPSHTAIGKFVLRGKGTSPTDWQHPYSYTVQPATFSDSHTATSAVVQLLGRVESCFKLSLLWWRCINCASRGQVCIRQPDSHCACADECLMSLPVATAFVFDVGFFLHIS